MPYEIIYFVEHINQDTEYIESVMMSIYGDDLMMTYPCHYDDKPEKIYMDMRNNMFDSVELQDLHDMQHRDYCNDFEGKASVCRVCKRSLSSREIIRACTDFIFNQYNQNCNRQCTKYNRICTEDITKEQMDIICMRHVYDYDEMVDNHFKGNFNE